MLGVFPIVLAYIFIFVKTSHDPLESVTQLDALLIISRNQRQMDYFEQNLYVTKDWGALTSEEKNQFNQIFLRGNSTETRKDLI